MFQPPKDEKSEEKGHAGLTTLFPGQKRRISHLSKQGKEVRRLAEGGGCSPFVPGTSTDVRPLCSCPGDLADLFLAPTVSWGEVRPAHMMFSDSSQRWAGVTEQGGAVSPGPVGCDLVQAAQPL